MSDFEFSSTLFFPASLSSHYNSASFRPLDSICYFSPSNNELTQEKRRLVLKRQRKGGGMCFAVLPFSSLFHSFSSLPTFRMNCKNELSQDTWKEWRKIDDYWLWWCTSANVLINNNSIRGLGNSPHLNRLVNWKKSMKRNKAVETNEELKLILSTRMKLII